MRALHRFFARLLNVVTRRRANQRLREEIEAHLAGATEHHLRAGMSPEAAARKARLAFGSAEVLRENYRAEESLPSLENLLLDLRYALRVLRKSPAFTATALLTLMLGVAANIVVFGVLNAVLWQGLDVSDPQNLYQLRHQQWTIGRLLTTSYPAFEDLRRRNSTFRDLLAINAYSHAQLRWHNTVTSVSGDEVTGNYFDVLGAQPQLGRFFHAADEHGSNSAPYVVLSDALWRRAFQADPSLVGTTVELNRHAFTIIGVAAPRFHGTERFAWPDYWIPILNQAQVDGWDALQNRASVAVTVIGRLKPAVTPAQATRDLNAIIAALATEYPQTDENVPLRLIHPGLIGDEGDVIRGFLYGVSALGLLVLAAACANLASLFAARTLDRGRELALRIALGSSRRRLARQLLTEAVTLSLIGGSAAVVLARLLFAVLSHLFVSEHLEVGMDARVLLAALVFTLGSALLFGMAPARHAWQSSPLQSMKYGPLHEFTFRRFAARDLLLGAQIAICTLLVTASLVAARGMMRALAVPLGFQPQGAMLADVDLSQTAQDGSDPLVRQHAILAALQQIPGVMAVGAVNRIPFTGGLHGVPIFPPGTSQFKLTNSVLAPYVFTMSPGYLPAAGTRLLQGREFTWSDTAQTPAVAIVNATLARRLWPGKPPIGQQFVLAGKLTEVVGVVEDGKYHDLEEAPQPVAYVPLSQNPASDAIFVVRSVRPPNEMSAALHRALNDLAPNVPVTVQSWTDALDPELLPARAATVALGAMGLLAALLAVTGIFAMAAYSVSRRMKELGIRVALGARKTQVMRAALGRPIALLGAGSVMGLLAGIVARPLLRLIVYQANPRDPLVIAAAVLTMALLGIAASAIPARRALAIDPSALMRED